MVAAAAESHNIRRAELISLIVMLYVKASGYRGWVRSDAEN